jgi:hypothetical protein
MKLQAMPVVLVLMASGVLFTPVGKFKLQLKPIGGAAVKPNTTEQLDPDEYWDMIQETIPSPGVLPVGVKTAMWWYDNRTAPKGFVYVFGGKTAYKEQAGTSGRYKNILAMYFDNNEYSGVTIALGDRSNIDLRSRRKARAAGIGFWCRGKNGGESIYVGLLDDESDEKKVQTKVALRDFGSIDTVWHYVMIPLRRFSSKGKYWDAGRKSEVLDDVDWAAINEVRFSVDRGANSVTGKAPVAVYVAHVAIVEAIPGYTDPAEYWAAFSSNAPEVVIHDFETDPGVAWETGTGPASSAAVAWVAAKDTTCGEKSLAITYTLNDWCDVMVDYRKYGTAPELRDWTKYWGVKLTACSDRAYQALNLQVSDAGNELYIAPCGIPSGCSEIIVPFREFTKFPYYQPPDARHDGTFDRDGVIMLDIKPAGEGTEGTFLVDNITLTNRRSVTKAADAAERQVTVRGNFGMAVTPHIHEGILGINAQHWDGDLLGPKSVEYVKKVGHRVIRFPGGLSADEYHWKEMLGAKDGNVDTDEFLEFCRKTGCEPMLTVNFGTGTAEEAASWVRYVNVVKKADVRYWEIGNELYGSWHKKHCTAEEYGKRAAAFITGMKNVDPSILVTVVWEIESPWNKTVFDYTKEITDGVNVHNYPQEHGEENDQALLAAPQALEGITGRIRRQLTSYGVPGKKYQTWLTEWNSVDFNPGPQSLGMVNALFTADYLGMLAKVNVEQASYWNIHNSMFVEGGDYGYLSRSDVPEGANVPRPSYWAFRLAAMSLRGTLVECSSNDINVTAYANRLPDGSASLLLINKYPETTAKIALTVPELTGAATEYQYTAATGRGGYTTRQVTVGKRGGVSVPPASITVLKFR